MRIIVRTGLVIFMVALASVPSAAQTIWAIDTSDNLLHFNSTTPGQIDGSVPVRNLQPGENLLGIDFRPATGQLYGIGSTNRVYVINPTTGFATAVGATTFAPALSGTSFGVDFNPVNDRLRVVSDADQNLRLDPDTGAVVSSDAPLAFAAGDSNFGDNPNVVAAAYRNNFAGTPATTLEGIDSSQDILVVQNPPNDGAIHTVGPLGVDSTDLVGFDIGPNGVAYASLTPTSPGTASNFYTINLTTGAAALVGQISNGPVLIRALAVQTGPDVIFGVTTGNNLVRFDSPTPGDVTLTTPITGLQPGEDLLAIDFRPATGQLYGLGSTSRIYRIDPASGAATAVGAGSFTPALSGADFGFDFNPTVDRIRIVSDANQNLRAHPDLGTIAFTDSNLAYAVGDPNQGADPSVVAAAYTNNFAGATTTTLYDIDSKLDILTTQSPPNNGALNTLGPLGVDTHAFVGFDISPQGTAYAALSTPSSVLYRVNLATGGATLIGVIGAAEDIRDIAVRVATEVVYAVTESAGPVSNLITFNAAVPGVIISNTAITGLQAGETIEGIDFRPATGQLFAVGSTSRVYVIDRTTGVATQVGTGTFTPALSGTNFGFDFNPTVDRIRVVSDANQNLRLNPNTGAVAFTDGPLAFAAGDPNQGDDPVVGAAAYTNNFQGSLTTTLYDLDSAQDILLTQSPPNDGTLNTIASLSVGAIEPVGLDISRATGVAYFTNANAVPGGNPELRRINLATGSAGLVGLINTTAAVIDIAVAIDAVAGADTVAIYNAASGAWFLRNSNTAGPADITFTFGPGGAGVLPIVGDWNGDGLDTPGIYIPATGTFFLRNENSNGPAEIAFGYGPGGGGFTPVVGDWDGNGTDTVGLYDAATGAFFLKNTNAAGGSDTVFTFGSGGNPLPVVGDWNGDGVDTIGLYDSASGAWFLRNANSSGPADVPAFTFGPAGATPLVGDFNGDAVDTVGVYVPATAVWFLRNSNTAGPADLSFVYGPPSQAPLIGDWNGT